MIFLFVNNLQAAPKDKLLVFDLNDGWEPLCKHLGKPIPSVPFPFLNKKGCGTHPFVAGMHPVIKRIQNEFYSILGISAATSLYLVYHFSTTSLGNSYLWRSLLFGTDAVLNRFGYFRK